jgi:hypothetical protein
MPNRRQRQQVRVDIPGRQRQTDGHARKTGHGLLQRREQLGQVHLRVGAAHPALIRVHIDQDGGKPVNRARRGAHRPQQGAKHRRRADAGNVPGTNLR